MIHLLGKKSMTKFIWHLLIGTQSYTNNIIRLWLSGTFEIALGKI